MDYPFVIKKLDCPDMEELAIGLEGNLKEDFSAVSVKVVDCPNLTQAPWNLSAEGLCGQPTLVDTGSVSYLLPVPDRTKVYSFPWISEKIGIAEAVFIGAGAGPSHTTNCNCELIANLKLPDKISSYIGILGLESQLVLEKTSVPEFCLLGNFLASEGRPGKVIEVVLAGRTRPTNFASSIREALLFQFPDQYVSLGGVMLMEKGNARVHVMPDFSDTPVPTDSLNSWLKFFDCQAPLVCVGVLTNRDPGLDIRLEHFHCFSHHGQGGHYHHDLSPEEVIYRGYFTVAERVVRVDRPQAP